MGLINWDRTIHLVLITKNFFLFTFVSHGDVKLNQNILSLWLAELQEFVCGGEFWMLVQ